MKLLVRLTLDRNVKGWSRSCGTIFLHGETVLHLPPNQHFWSFVVKGK